jgi:methionine sulfoxide reductase heme-binding subunit
VNGALPLVDCFRVTESPPECLMAMMKSRHFIAIWTLKNIIKFSNPVRIQPHQIFWLKVIIHTVALAYAGVFYFWAITDELGADPVKAIIHFTGMGALNLLLLTLTVSPAARYFKQPALIKLRRLLGLYCFTYAILHVSNYLLFDLQLAFDTLLQDIIKRPYITVGFISLIILTVLALTSPKFIQQTLGKSWLTIHKAIYPCILLVCLHFVWSVKAFEAEPVIYAGISTALLCLRNNRMRQKLLKK